MCVAATSAPVGALLSTTTPYKSAAAATVAGVVVAATTIGGDDVAVPGNYRLVAYATNGGGTCDDLTSQTVLASATQVVGGAVAAVTVTPGTQATANATAATYAVVATDSAGRRTLFGAANVAATTPAAAQFGADTYGLSSNSSTTTFNGSSDKTLFGQVLPAFSAENTAAGTATLTLTANNASVTPATATLTTIAAGTPNGVDIVSDNVSGDMPAGTTSVTFAITGLAAEIGKRFVYSVSGSAATAAANQLSDPAVAAPDGSAIATVTVPLVNTIAGKDVTLEDSAGNSATVTLVQRDLDSVTPAVIVAKPGNTVTVTGVVSDQFGDPVASAAVTGSVTGSNTTATTNAITSAAGQFSVTYTSSAASSADDTVNLTVTQGAYGASPFAHSVTVKFTATGVVDMTSLDFGSVPSTSLAAFAGTVTVPFDGTADTTVAGTNAADVGDLIELTGTAAVGGVAVTYSTTEGFVSTSPTTLWSAGKKSVTATSGTPVYFFSTKTGRVEVTATAGGDTLRGAIDFVSPEAGARNLKVTAAPSTVAVGGTSSVTIEVTDVFGNPSALGAGTGEASVALQTNLGTLAGGSSVFTLNSLNSEGRATITVTSQVAGVAKVSAAGTNGQFGLSAGNPVGAPAPVKSASADVEFGTSSKSIAITGSRDNRLIKVSGTTAGIENGKTVTPFIRFPGQTTFTAGTARPAISDDKVSWQRKTGKRVTVYLELSDDSSVRSNRVTIQAR